MKHRHIFLLQYFCYISIIVIGGWATTIGATTRCVQVLRYPSISLVNNKSYSTNNGIETPIAINAPGFTGQGIIVSGQTSSTSEMGGWLTVLTAFLSESEITMSELNSGNTYTVPISLHPTSDTSTNESWCTSGKCVYKSTSGPSKHSLCSQNTQHGSVSISGTLLLSSVPPGRYSLSIPVNLLAIQGVWGNSTIELNLNEMLNAMGNNYNSYATKRTVLVTLDIPVHCSFESNVYIDLGALTPTMSKIGSSKISYTCTAPTSGIVSLTAATKSNNSVKSTTGVTIGLGNSHDTVISVNGWPLSDVNNKAKVDLKTSESLTVTATATPVAVSNITTGKVEGAAILKVTHD